MATQKNKAEAGAEAARVASYEAALEKYTAAVDTLRRGAFDDARERFAAVEDACNDEPELAERARMYRRVCERRGAAPPAEPTDAEGHFRRAVVLANERNLDEARGQIERALTEEPRSATFLYVRASIHALDGNVSEAVSDLRQALAADPTVRFQAVNDPDFERIREEPAFIDVIEPTPSGA